MDFIAQAVACLRDDTPHVLCAIGVWDLAVLVADYSAHEDEFEELVLKEAAAHFDRDLAWHKTAAHNILLIEHNVALNRWVSKITASNRRLTRQHLTAHEAVYTALNMVPNYGLCQRPLCFDTSVCFCDKPLVFTIDWD